MSTRDLAARALVMQVVANEVTKQAKTAREPLEDEISNADRVNVASPVDEDVKLGMVYRTDTKATATVTDEEAFLKWHRDNHPDRVEWVKVLNGGRMEEILAIVEARNPDLILSRPVVKEWAREEVLKATVKAREPVGPHGELDDLAPPVRYNPPKRGTLTIKPSDEAADHIRALWTQGRIDLGTGQILELE